ncbi:MAG: hypothetical protein K2Y23_17435 [Cyanobacteria bacterium]|nr:hypothetical protein [Cyanobacteriota bacterium]
MKKLVASALVVALAIAAAPINLIAAARFQAAGQISGVATVDGKPLANVAVRLRNVDTGQLVGNTTANELGQFSFTGLGAGNFVVETVAANGTILGTSTTIALTAAAMAATGITVATSGPALGGGGSGGGGVGGGGAAGAGAAATGVGASPWLIGLVVAGSIIGATTVIVVKNDASPSQ